MLLIGLALLALVVAYVQRPVRRPRGKRWRR
jgi:hypothetical protein